ncbi:(2Fe-2S) ferredoxin [Polymorphobacter glacialis]|uniref:(2Fe-2S) ferredoxin n=1 Tax=Sandarakinorhabdus glacialis TaxID=1614636 RepID=A0A916ZJE8_9SPHN|nr:2Fe-2S iron-sulfur cluster-binding protein [Polymorphobacter glacialis]GGE00851.1 (2Fe-2S) ferredoxin [Polymorphobacter glacialis]
MAHVTYIEFNGTPHTVDVADGVSLMEGALQNGVPGIDGDCGGNAACATCHVYVADGWMGKIGERSESEEAMLDLADGLQENSRLACQIFASDGLEGLVVSMPESQH